MTDGMGRGARRVAAVLLIASGMVSLACGGDGGGPNRPSIANFITAVQTAGGTANAVRVSGVRPAEGGGPTPTLSGGASVINGGSAQIQVSAGAQFTTAYVSVAGYNGYYRVDLPAPVTDLGLVLTLGRNLPDPSFSIDVAVAANGATGLFAGHDVAVISAVAGQVQVSVSWTGASDVDLHVVEPSGEEIYYGNDVSATGGTLDLDSNPACSIDNVNNENITWSTNAPTGSYIVRLDYYDACGVAQSDYVVTVQRQGAQPLVFQGTLTGPGDQGGLGDGITITTFNH